MRLRFGAEADLRQLAYTIDQFGDIFPELRTDVVLGCLGVLDDIMQYRGDDHLVIKAHVSENFCNLERVEDVGFAGSALLTIMRFGAEQVSPIDVADFVSV